MVEIVNKKVTMDVTPAQHRKLKDATKSMDVTQQELLGIIIDLTLTNIESVRPHVIKYVQRRDAEAQKNKEREAKAKQLISQLTEEQLEKLLAGQLVL